MKFLLILILAQELSQLLFKLQSKLKQLLKTKISLDSSYNSKINSISKIKLQQLLEVHKLEQRKQAPVQVPRVLMKLRHFPHQRKKFI